MQDVRRTGELSGFIGGPSCPDFSVAGKNAGSEDETGRLSKSYLDLTI
ncbi:DNA cytosine methyltransferase [Candidatus Aquiluna sp. UB-MaderosW2red]